MKYLPIQLVVAGARVLLVGGGDVALRKASVMARAGAHVAVVAPRIQSSLKQLLLPPHVWAERPFEVADVEGARLVVAATDDRQLNARVSAAARAAGVPVNVVDQPDLCTFIMPALVDRAPILVGVSSAGAAPVLARTLRARIEALLPSGLGELARLLERYRGEVKARFGSVPARRAFWERVLDGPVAELVYAGELGAAEARLQATLAAGEIDPPAAFVVAAGPGRPEDLTLLAQRCLQRAEHILHTAEVPETLLDQARRDAGRTVVDGNEEPLSIAARLDTHLVRHERICWLHLGTLSPVDEAVECELVARGRTVVMVPGLPLV